MRYYFNLVSACETIPDRVGIELADAPAQVLEALILDALAHLRDEDGEQAKQWMGWMLEICDASRVVVLMFDLAAVDRLRLLANALGTADRFSIVHDLAANPN
jgi:hypothetical protein